MRNIKKPCSFKFTIFNGWHGMLYITVHTGLTRVSSIQFLLFEIKRGLVLYSIIIYFTDLFIFYIFIQSANANKKKIYKKRLTNYVWLVKLWSKVTAFWNIDRTVKSTWVVLQRVYRVSHKTLQLVNSFECRLPYTVLDIKGCLQFISFKNYFAQTFFTFKLILL